MRRFVYLLVVMQHVIKRKKCEHHFFFRFHEFHVMQL